MMGTTAIIGVQIDLSLIVLIFTVFTFLQHMMYGMIYSKLIDGLGMYDKKLWAWIPVLNLVVFYLIVQSDKTSQNTKTLLVVASLFLAILPITPWIFILQGNAETGLILGAVNMIILQVFFYGYGILRFNKIFESRIKGVHFS